MWVLFFNITTNTRVTIDRIIFLKSPLCLLRNFYVDLSPSRCCGIRFESRLWPRFTRVNLTGSRTRYRKLLNKTSSSSKGHHQRNTFSLFIYLFIYWSGVKFLQSNNIIHTHTNQFSKLVLIASRCSESRVSKKCVKWW